MQVCSSPQLRPIAAEACTHGGVSHTPVDPAVATTCVYTGGVREATVMFPRLKPTAEDALVRAAAKPEAVTVEAFAITASADMLLEAGIEIV